MNYTEWQLKRRDLQKREMEERSGNLESAGAASGGDHGAGDQGTVRPGQRARPSGQCVRGMGSLHPA